MTVGILKVELTLFGSHSLKEKRAILKSLKDRIRRKFNVSIAELEGHDKWQRAVLGVVNIGTDNRVANSALSKVIELIKNTHSVELIDYNMELL